MEERRASRMKRSKKAGVSSRKNKPVNNYCCEMLKLSSREELIGPVTFDDDVVD